MSVPLGSLPGVNNHEVTLAAAAPVAFLRAGRTWNVGGGPDRQHPDSIGHLRARARASPGGLVNAVDGYRFVMRPRIW